MDGWVCMNGCMNGQMDGWMDRCMCGCVDAWLHGCMDRWWIHERKGHIFLKRVCNSFVHHMPRVIILFNREAKFPTSKVLCFTRSSPLIHQLPAQYPSHALERQSKDDIKQTLKVQKIQRLITTYVRVNCVYSAILTCTTLHKIIA